MIAFKAVFKRYTRDQGGAYAVLFAMTAGFLALAAHVGIDALRIQNSGTSAEQLVDIACQKIATADPALYPTPEALKNAIEAQMATRRVAGTDVTDGALTVEVVADNVPFVQPLGQSDGNNIDLCGNTFKVGYSGAVRGVHRDIAPTGAADVKIAKPCKPVCSGMTNVIYSNGAALGHWLDGTTLKAAEYVDDKAQMIGDFTDVAFDAGFANPGKNGDRLIVTIMDDERRIRFRKIVTLPDKFYLDNDSKRAPGEPASKSVKRYVVDDGDQIVIQTFNADGTLPTACGDSETPPSCSGANCGGSIGGPDPCADGSCGAPQFVCNAPDLPTKKPYLSLGKFDSRNTAKFTYPPADKSAPGKLELTWYPSGRTVTVKLAPFFEKNTTPVTLTFKDKVSKTVTTDEASALSYMSLGNRYLFLMPTAKYPDHRYLVDLAGWQYSTWWDGHDRCFNYKSPIVFDTKGLGAIKTTRDGNANTAPLFDYFGDGRKVRVEWPVGDGQAWLVDNRDGRAAIDMNGKRLFGDLDGHEHGYAKLAERDTSGTGILTGRDLDGLALWFDNGNAIVEDGEMRPLADAGVTAIDTRSQWQTLPDGRAALRSTATMNGRTIMTEDIYVDIETPALRISKAPNKDGR